MNFYGEPLMVQIILWVVITMPLWGGAGLAFAWWCIMTWDE